MKRQKLYLLSYFVFFCFSHSIQVSANEHNHFIAELESAQSVRLGFDKWCAINTDSYRCFTPHGKDPITNEHFRTQGAVTDLDFQIYLGFTMECIHQHQKVSCRGDESIESLPEDLDLKNDKIHDFFVSNSSFCWLNNSREIRCNVGRDLLSAPFFRPFPTAEANTAPIDEIDGSVDPINRCILQENRVRCWNRLSEINSWKEARSLELKNPHNLKVVDQMACVIHGTENTQLKCWGEKKFDINYSQFINPKRFDLDQEVLCVLDDEGFKCWNNRDGNLTKYTSSTDLEEFSVNDSLVCYKAQGKKRNCGAIRSIDKDKYSPLKPGEA